MNLFPPYGKFRTDSNALQIRKLQQLGYQTGFNNFSPKIKKKKINKEPSLNNADEESEKGRTVQFHAL